MTIAFFVVSCRIVTLVFRRHELPATAIPYRQFTILLDHVYGDRVTSMAKILLSLFQRGESAYASIIMRLTAHFGGFPKTVVKAKKRMFKNGLSEY